MVFNEIYPAFRIKNVMDASIERKRYMVDLLHQALKFRPENMDNWLRTSFPLLSCCPISGSKSKIMLSHRQKSYSRSCHIIPTIEKKPLRGLILDFIRALNHSPVA